MATIRRRNKKYQVQIRKNAHQSISKTFIDLKAARKWANHMEDRIELGEQFYQSNNSITLKEVIHRYLNEITPFKRGKESETRRINRLLKEPICREKIYLLQTKDFIEFRDKRIRDGNRTCHYDLVLLRHIFNVTIKQWNLFNLDNPLVNVPKPKLNPSRQRRLTQAEYNFLVRGNSIQKKVWRELKNIKFGKTKTYGEIAKKYKLSPRHVGKICGQNKLLLLIPCHRVIRADGSLGGFTSLGGIKLKKKLLDFERSY